MDHYNTGVIIGRFQVDDLTEAHQALIDTAAGQCDKVIIFIGTTVVRDSDKNPLDYRSREHMVCEYITDFLPDRVQQITVLPLPDQAADVPWSQYVDAVVRAVDPMGSVRLFAGRDSFAPHYHGNFHIVEIKALPSISGTDRRKQIAAMVMTTGEQRQGVINAKMNQWPKVHPTVDMAVVRYDSELGKYFLAMGKKPTDTAWRLPGGFVDPTDESYEAAGRRELIEEMGMNLSVGKGRILTSMKIDDWRYGKERNKIMTTLILYNYEFGPLTAGDDLAKAEWIAISDLTKGTVEVVNAHKQLIIALLEELKL